MTVINERIIQDAINRYGKEKQLIVSMEELAELTQAVSKFLRDKPNFDNIAEEIADVLICVETIKRCCQISDEGIQYWIDKKQKRVKKKLNNES